MDTKTPPSSWYYALGGALLIAGFVIFGIYLFTAFASLGEFNKSLIRMLAPGSETVKLDKTGTYKIYYEYEGKFGGKSYVSPKEGLPGMECSVRNAETGTEILLSPVSASETYDFFGSKGTAIFKFDLTEPGRYVIATSLGEGYEGEPRYLLSVGTGFTAVLATTIMKIFIAIGSLIVCLIASAAVFIIVFLKRSKALAQAR